MNCVRTCLGCRQRATKSSLLRLVARGDEVVVDHSTSLPGRGAWVHPSIDCVDTALIRKAFGRALRNPKVTIDAEALRRDVLTWFAAYHPTGTEGSGTPYRTGSKAQ
ncbi:MAG TPA: YlxR family protein [Marisediminicola sp.]|nr:YlxR family protein [Marisediminicola sp.]